MGEFDLSAFLRERITVEGLTQEAFARQIGITQPSLNGLLNGGDPARKTYETLIRRYPQLIGLAIFRTEAAS